jgi:hypothetical protein
MFEKKGGPFKQKKAIKKQHLSHHIYIYSHAPMCSSVLFLSDLIHRTQYIYSSRSGLWRRTSFTCRRGADRAAGRLLGDDAIAGQPREAVGPIEVDLVAVVLQP